MSEGRACPLRRPAGPRIACIGLAVPGRSVPGRGGPERRRRPRPDGTEPPMLTRLLRYAPRRPGTDRYRGGTTLRHPPSLKTLRAGTAAATTLRGQFRSRCATAASPAGSCHEAVVIEGGPHPPVKAEPTAPRCARCHPHRPCHKRAIHSGPERSRADNHGQSRSSLDLHRSPPSQVTAAPELALGAGGRWWFGLASALPWPASRSDPWSRRTGTLAVSGGWDRKARSRYARPIV
jgi:hypothetical protein